MYKEFFTDSKHSAVHIFEIANSPYPAQSYSRSMEFSSGKKKIKIIDQFQGKRPLLLNKEFLIEKKDINLQIILTLLLDSHIVDMLHRYVSDTNNTQETNDIVKDFLLHTSKLNCDYSPVFYLTENWVKSSNELFMNTASKKLSSILKLHSMREDIFIERNEIIYKKEAIDYYYELYKATSFTECGWSCAKRFLESGKPEFYSRLTNVSYACLLKMVLIYFMNPKINSNNIIKKYYEFEKFIINDIGCILARELNLALYYFSGLAGKFIGVQPSMNLSKAIHNLKSTSWDLLLLRLPEFLLRPDRLPEICTAYIVTAEKKLIEIGELFKIESLLYSTPTSQSFPLLSFDMSPLNNFLSKKELDELELQTSKLLIKRSIDNKDLLITNQKLKWLIEDLELQLSYLCN